MLNKYFPVPKIIVKFLGEKGVENVRDLNKDGNCVDLTSNIMLCYVVMFYAGI